MLYLSEAQRDAYVRDGFLVIPDFETPEACRALMDEADRLIDGFEMLDDPSVFTTTDQTRTTDAYFLDSGDRIRFFFEAGALGSDGRPNRPKHRAINKIGHALHDLDPVFARASHQRRLADLVADLGMAQPLLMQSMYIMKPPEIGGEVVCHQDSTFLYTEPLSVVGLWLALEDATVENGCMWAIPGGHRDGLRQRFRRDGRGGVATDTLDPAPWPDFVPGHGPHVPLPARQGTLIVLHGLVPHLSPANRSDRPRRAYTLHVVDGAAEYPADNWLQRRADMPARGF